MEYQHTLAKPATLTGTSLHTGEAVTLTMAPAPVGHGIKFRRMDLEDQPFIPASVDKVQMVERATTLAEGSVKVHTVEHVISALAGMGVDNALIEMDANEPPIGDGQRAPTWSASKRRESSRRMRPAACIRSARADFTSRPKAAAFMIVVPDKKFRISCTQVGPDGRLTQYFSTEITPEIYEKEIAPARTFVFYEDVKGAAGQGPDQRRQPGKRRS